jgi:hypothetical protein
MSDLTHFLLERIDEDERHARKLAEADRRPVLSLATTVNHPGRILLECEAKRRIVEEWRRAQDEAEAGDTSGRIAAFAFSLALQHLALPYADHPDYDASWRP